ncbi:MAG: hypothetical protein OER56_08725 [Hyphomicrobiales bacterium]|nr:hypothetical protein [Hyphomicrobiales bacterium]
MTSIADIGAELDTPRADLPAGEQAARLLQLGEGVLEHWARARELEPTDEEREGFRLLALHRQGAKGEPSFNACRETCRELAYHYNLVCSDAAHPEVAKRLEMMRLVAMHLYLFVSGKMQVDQLGEFCCASKPLRLAAQT